MLLRWLFICLTVAMPRCCATMRQIDSHPRGTSKPARCASCHAHLSIMGNLHGCGSVASSAVTPSTQADISDSTAAGRTCACATVPGCRCQDGAAEQKWCCLPLLTMGENAGGRRGGGGGEGESASMCRSICHECLSLCTCLEQRRCQSAQLQSCISCP